MHMTGNPKTMHLNPVDERPVRELALFFHMKISQLNTAGIYEIILDPGFGFGKSLSANYELLNKLDQFNFLNKPTLVGISRKSMIQKVTGANVEEALNGTTALHLVALERGCRILRVHDVKAAISCIALNKKLMETVV
jgi:dihydropteroate synthase